MIGTKDKNGSVESFESVSLYPCWIERMLEIFHPVFWFVPPVSLVAVVSLVGQVSLLRREILGRAGFLPVQIKLEGAIFLEKNFS